MFREWPTVTAVINTFERPHTLDRALASVLAQDYIDMEVLMIHDGPASEETVKVAEKYYEAFEAKEIDFSFMGLEENSGYQCVPKNVGVEHARGDYIAYLDDDNEWTPDHLSALVSSIEEGEQWPDFVYGRRLYVADDDAPDNLKASVGESPLILINENTMAGLATSPMNNFIDTSDTLITRGAMWMLHANTGMMWNERLRRFGDWELFTRALFYGGWRGKAVDRVVQVYHWHGGNLQHTRPARETPTLKGYLEDVGV